jgi:hypothetical protein
MKGVKKLLKNEKFLGFLNSALRVVDNQIGTLGDFTRASKKGKAVIGRQKIIENPKYLFSGERKLAVKVGETAKSTWKSNSSELRKAIREGQPIRDVTPDVKTPFLEAERNLLKEQGWTFDGTNWNPQK